MPKDTGQKHEKKPFTRYPIGYLHIDIREVWTGEDRAYLFVAVDRTSKFVHAQLYRQMTRQVAADFLEDTLKALPYRAHTVLTDNGVQFAKKAGTETYKSPIFDVVCYRHGIEHRLEALPSLDQRPGGADESHDQGGHNPSVPLHLAGAVAVPPQDYL